MKIRENGITPNLMRVLATLFVFLLHGRAWIPKIQELPQPFQWITCLPAWAGVWIFLILSGYVIGYGFFSKRYNLYDENGKLRIRYFVKFYIGRFVKLAPLYYFYCIMFEVLTGNLFFWNNGKCLFKMLTFTFNGNGGISKIGHLWYISTAMQLYLFMPFFYIILNCIRKRKLILMILYISTIVGGIFMRNLLMSNGYAWYTCIYTNCFANLDLILAGMLISQIRITYIKAFAKQYVFKMLAAVIFICLVLYNCYIYYVESFNCLRIYQCTLPSAYVGSCGILLLVSGGGKKKEKFSWFIKCINKFSEYSYSFYIFHIAVFQYLGLTMLESTWYRELNAELQYIIFFGTSFIFILVLSVPFNWIGKTFVEKYKRVERRIFKY